jgi:aryl-alcohol dehydrogenase-like predicted oxidoreductase
LRTRNIGSLEVTVVGVGSNNFGRQLSAGLTRQVIHAALDEGVNFFDTADTYGNPATTSETLIGEILRPHRDEVIIATKFGRFLDEEHHGAKPAYVRSATEASLRRLQTDYIDLMQLHIPDPDTPIADTLGALAELLEEGKIREIGISNFDVQQLREASEAAQQKGTPHFVSTQAKCSMLDRHEAADILAECEDTGMRLLPFQPLYNGLLTGRYRPGEPVPSGSRIGTKSKEAQATIMSSANMAIVAALTEYAEAAGHTLLELAIGWLLAQPAVASVIAGVSSPAQIVSNVAATGWELTKSELNDVEKLLG